MSCFKMLLPLSSVLIGLLVGTIPTMAQPYEDSIKQNNKKQSDLPPIVRIVSPVADALIPPGEGRVSAGSPNGTGFALNIEVVTRDSVPVTVTEALNIRDTNQLGKANPNFPGLFVFFDTDLITPDGGIIPKNTNLAALFNVAGTDDTPGPGVTIWTGWHVLESLPPDVNTFTITTAVIDNAGRMGLDRVTLRVQRDGATSGQVLTSAPSESVSGDGQDDPDGPEVTMIAPRVPTRVSPGPAGTPVLPDGSLFFIQVTALDRAKAGIGVTEGVILDANQIPTGGPNRNYPTMTLTFDVPLRQPNGNLVPAGANLAPLFNIAGSEIDSDGIVRTIADWVVGGSLELPPGKNTVTITARVTNNAGRTGSVRQVVGISAVTNGQDLTPNGNGTIIK
jgi:hypothetical protein